MAPDYDHLTLMQKVEVFEHAVNNTAGDDLAKLLWLKSPSSEVSSAHVLSSVQNVGGVGALADHKLQMNLQEVFFPQTNKPLLLREDLSLFGSYWVLSGFHIPKCSSYCINYKLKHATCLPDFYSVPACRYGLTEEQTTLDH